jgi:acetyltransferase-like isoleucine patch superfamily enzyme
MKRVIDIFFKVFNIIKFRYIGVTVGKSLRVSGPVCIVLGKKGKIIVGDNFRLVSGKMYNSIGRNIKSCLRADVGSEIIIGNDVGMSNVCIWAKKSIKIGDNVKVGADAIIIDSDMHALNFRDRRNEQNDVANAKSKSVEIGDDVFIGMRSIICKGVLIGDRAIIGAASVVTTSVPADETWAGNPARFIKKNDTVV